ncbi:MAG: terminase TerL endonuclease subunit [Sphingomonadaceae bacterium]
MPSCFEEVPRKPLKPGTIGQYRYNVTIIVSALVQCGVAVSALKHLADVVRPGNIDRAMQYLHQRADGKITPQMFQLAFRARTIARWCKLSDSDLERLDRIFYSIREQHDLQRGMTPKNRALLNRLDDKRFADNVQLLPFLLMERALKNPGKPWAPALARTAMAIEVLLMCSVRRANLTALELGRSIKRIGQGKDAFWIIEHEAEEVKNEEPLRFRLPDQTVAMLEIYLNEWRPKLCPTPSPWLFPAPDGSCIGAKTMAHAIRAQTKRVLGVAITPHQFRHISAELFMMDNPDGLFTVSQHLGHRDVNPETDWRDESAWHAANPAIDAGFCSMDELRIKARRIEHFPAEIADFRRFHLNQWQEGAANPWLALEVYDAAEAMTPIEDLAGQPCWVGIDLSSVEDLTAVVAVFPEDDDEGQRYDVLPMFFLPEANIAKKGEKDRADYMRWAAEGVLTLTPGNVVDHSAIVDHVIALGERYGVQEIAIDRWNSTAVNTSLQEEGFTVSQFGQGFASMAAPVKELKRAILTGHFRHGGNPLLRMCFGNVVADKDAAENEKFTKERARGRIDGAVAAAIAVGRILANEITPSPYEAREGGFLFL